MKSLVLDSNHQPISIISWEKAIQSILNGKAQQLEKPGMTIRTVSKEFDMPSVLVILEPIPYREKRLSYNNSQNLFVRDKYTCAYCGKRKRKSELTKDHINPIVQGGKNSWTNLITACRPCNQKKAGRTPKQANMELKYKPFEPKPNSSYLLASANEEQMKQWAEYLGEDVLQVVSLVTVD
jgi:hypothetical protein